VYGQIKTGTPTSSTASKPTNGESPENGAAMLAGPTYDTLDMMLMHHFCTSTANSMSASPNAQHVWREVVPVYANTNLMLMHGVLTLAANHYVHLHKSDSDSVTLHNYRTRGLYHQQLGLQIFRHHVQNPSEDQSHEILLTFAAVLGMLTFADADTEPQALTFDDALALLAVLRGKQALWRAGSGVSADSNLAPAFFDPPPSDKSPELSSTAFALGELQAVAEDDVRKRSIAALKAVVESQTSSEFRMLGTWPAGLSDEFLRLLKLRDGVALRSFEHYCTIVDSMCHLWWVGDVGKKLRAAIQASAVTE
jgi:hypothetical protein